MSGQDARWLMLNHSFVKFFFGAKGTALECHKSTERE